MPGFHCATCGQYHDQLPMCLGPDAPALWHSLPQDERDSRGSLSTDQCVIDGEHFFVRGRIVIPVIDGPEHFVWLVWVSLSEKNFDRVQQLWNTQGRESEPPYFGWLQSALPYPTPTLSLKTSVQTMPYGERPLITVEPESHQLAVEQQNGISMARVQQIAEVALH